MRGNKGAVFDVVIGRRRSCEIGRTYAHVGQRGIPYCVFVELGSWKVAKAKGIADGLVAPCVLGR